MRPADLVRRARRIAFIVGAVALALFLVGCSSETVNHNPTSAGGPSLLPGRVVTVQGDAAVSLYLITFVIAVVVFVLVEGLLIFITLRFRRKKGDDELPTQTHGNNRLEILWTIIPAVVVTVLFLLAVNVLNNTTDAMSPPAVTVDVTGFQWQWTFAYPDYLDNAGKPISMTGAGIQGPEMVLPTNENILFRVTGQDVIHSFYVPQFFYKKDAIPGRINEFDLTITDPGTYGGQCAEFCGLGHSTMFFTVRAVSPADFQQWEQDAVAQANATPTPPPPPPSGGATTQLTISTSADKPIAFSTDTLTAAAGSQVTVQYQNDSNVAHNIVFFAGSDANAPRIAGTQVQSGPGVTESVSFTAPTQPGTYFFHCDVHPDQMFGTFVVTP